MLNNCTLIGRLTKDIDLRSTRDGKSVAQFTLAVDRDKKDSGADFINCIAWGKSAEIIERYVRKGDMLGIIGKIQTRNYEDRTGKKVYVTEVMVDRFQFLERKQNPESVKYTEVSDDFVKDVSDTELPF